MVSAQTHQGPNMTGLHALHGPWRVQVEHKSQKKNARIMRNNGRFWNAIGGRVYVASRSRKGRCWSLGGLPIADPM